MSHIPVLEKEVLEYFSPKPDENFIDATIGGGGHALKILESIAPGGKLLGIDANEQAIAGLAKRITEQKIENRLFLVCDNFSNLQNIIEQYGFDPVRGVLADLGFSSDELELGNKGFSFLKDEPLNMGYSRNVITAQNIVNKYDEKELADIFWRYGEERFAKKIARKIINERKLDSIKTTFDLVRIIKKATPSWYHHRRIHPATKTFQALRIAVNDELGNLIKFLPQAFGALANGGRLAIISFHSLEDRIVKNFYKQKKEEGLAKILTKNPIRPSEAEINQNPRSRSAKLRVLEKI